MIETVVDLPDKMQFLFEKHRYKVAYGGRGGIKSWSFARAALIIASSMPVRILCARELQNSIKESVHQLLKQQVAKMNLDAKFKILAQAIVGSNGSEFIFSGLRDNITKIKSMEGIDIVWVEEAEKVSENSWSVLIPTIRKSGSEIWVSFNPDQESDPTYKRFVLAPPPDAVVVATGWQDNPWLPEELRREKDYLKRVDYDAYLHVWEGGLKIRSDSQVLGGKWRVADDWYPADDWDGPYYGIDWGFAQDPATCVKLWIHSSMGKDEEGRPQFQSRLYIDEEFWGIGVEINDLPESFDSVSGARDHASYADNARPETISYVQRHGYPKILPCQKWEGCIKDGISFLRAFEEIIIRSACTHAIEEARTYRHKVDKLTGLVLAIILDANNHIWDAVRYALGPIIVTKGMAFFEYHRQLYAQRQIERAQAAGVSVRFVKPGEVIREGGELGIQTITPETDMHSIKPGALINGTLTEAQKAALIRINREEDDGDSPYGGSIHKYLTKMGVESRGIKPNNPAP